MANFVTMGILGLTGFIGLLMASRAVDNAIYAHGLLLSVFCLLGIFLVVARGKKMAEDVANGGYDMDIVRAGLIASVFWGIVGFTVGLVLALQLAFPVLNFDLAWLNFGRLRPLHTSAVIFSFGGNVLIMTSFYVVQRTVGCGLQEGGPLGSYFGAISFLSLWRQRATSAALPNRKNMRSLNGTSIYG